MSRLTHSQIAAALSELRTAHPELQIWTEIVGHEGLHWVARGNPSPWLVMSDNLDRFRTALLADDERGLCAYSHPGPCEWPGEDIQDPPMEEMVGPDGCGWLVTYKAGHMWAILWGPGRHEVRAWPPLHLDEPAPGPPGDPDA